MPRWARNQAIVGAASLVSQASTGRRVSASTMRVAYRRARRSAKSSMATTRNLGVGGSGIFIRQVSRLAQLTAWCKWSSNRDPAFPASAVATVTMIACSPGVRRW